MAMNVRQTAVGVFDEHAMADHAVEDLRNAGFDAGQIHYSGHGTARTGGFFEGLKSFFTGEGSADTTGNDVDDFSRMGFSNDQARWYNDQYDAGRAVVSVRTADRMDEAMQILRANGAYNYDMRVGTATTTGTTTTTQTPAAEYTRTTDVNQQSANYLGQPDTNQQSVNYLDTADTSQQSANYLDTANTSQQSANYLGQPDRDRQAAEYTQTTNYADTASTADVDTDESRRLRLREEQLQATTERVQSGEVTVHKDVVSEERTINVPVTHEEVYVEQRDAAAGQVDTTPIGEGEVIRVPVSDEQVQVTKTPVVTGEVSVGKRAIQENQQVTDTVRREEARLGRSGDVNVQGSGADLIDRNADVNDTTTTTTDTDTRNSL